METKKIADSWRHGHRARLREKFLAGKLTDRELLELLLTYAIPRMDVKHLAHALFDKYGGIHKIISAPFEDLCKFDGLKESTAVFLKSIYETTLSDYKDCLSENPMFHDHKKLEEYCRLKLSGKRHEEFHAMYLDPFRRMLADDVHSVGTVDHTAAYPREILKRAMNLNAAFVIIMHNHPNGQRFFSCSDIKLTIDIKNELEKNGIALLDHFLIADDLVFSAKSIFMPDNQ